MKRQVLFMKPFGSQRCFKAILSSIMVFAIMFLLSKSYAQGPTQAWQKHFGGTANETATTWVETADGGYLIGGSSRSGVSSPNKSTENFGGQDYWILKVNASGDKVWEKNYGGTGNDILKDITKCANGDFILAGNSNSGSNSSGFKTEGSNGEMDYWIMRINSSGDWVWDKSFGGAGDDKVAAVVENSDGTLIIGGTSVSSTGGNKASEGKGSEDYWVIKLTAAGGKVSGWDFTYGGGHDSANKIGYDFLTGIEKTSDGGYLLAGYSNSSAANDKSQTFYDDNNNPTVSYSDYWIVKINSSGTKVWDKVYGGNEAEKLYDISPADGADQFLLVGSSRSSNTGNKTNSPANISWDVADHIWTLKIDASGTNNGAIVWSRTDEGRPKVRNYFDNISSVTNSTGYLLFLNARDKDGITKRIDQYNWAGTKQWSKSLADTSHYQTNRKLYQVLNTSFDTLQLKVNPQTRKLYQAFINAFEAGTNHPNPQDGLFSKAYPGKIELGSRGSLEYQGYVMQMLEEGIQDPKLIKIIHDFVKPLATTFETENQLWPEGVPLPGASKYKTVNGVYGNFVIDKWCSDYNKKYDATNTDQKSAYMRRKYWVGKDNPTPTGEWGEFPTVEERKSVRYKYEAANFPNNTNRRHLFLNTTTDYSGMPNYGTANSPLNLQLGSYYLFWAGYILDINRHLDPTNYGGLADIIWSYKSEWEVNAQQVLGNKHPTYKFFDKMQDLHHPVAAMAGLYKCFELWHTLRDGGPRADDLTARKYIMQAVLDDFYQVPVPSNAPEADKYVGAKIANYCHWNNPFRVLNGNNETKTSAGDATYSMLFSGILRTLAMTKTEGTSGARLTDAHFEALSNTYALIVERPAPQNGKWHIANNVAGGKNSALDANAYLNTSSPLAASGFRYGKTSSVIDSGKTDSRRAIGGNYLSWDKTGRQYRFFQYRAKNQTDDTKQQFDVANVLANVDHEMRNRWGWLGNTIIFNLRRPEFNLLDPNNPNVPLDLTNENNKGFIGLSGTDGILVLTTKDISSTNTDYDFIKYSGTGISNLEAENAVLSNVSVQTRNTGYMGTGYARFDASTGAYIEWTVNSNTATSTLLNFRYANGGTTDRPVELKVNGVVVNSSLPFPPSGGDWATWITQSAIVNLVAGNNTVRLTTTGTVGANIDNLSHEVSLKGSLEAEDAAFSGASVQTNNSGYTGTGYVRYDVATGAYIEWTVNTCTAGSVDLNFRYANGGTADRPVELKVNGEVINASLPFPPSGGTWSTWILQNAKANLVAGENKIRLTTTGTIGANIDNLSYEILLPGTLETEYASRSNVSVQTRNTGYTGTGYGRFDASTGAYIEWKINTNTATSASLDFRYANGGTTSRPVELKVNGVVVNSSLPFSPSGGDWATWVIQNQIVNLAAGVNTIRLTTTGTIGPNIDHLAYQTVEPMQTQTITFDSIGTKTYGDAPFTLVASASSGLPVTFSVFSGPATVSDSILTITGGGTVIVRASQAGDTTYAAAADVERTFTVDRAAQTTTFDPIPTKTYGDAAFALSATASSGLTPTFSVVSGPATYADSTLTLTLTGAGTVVVRASQPGNHSYLPATDVDQTFTVNKASQTLTFETVPTKTYGDAPFDLPTTASSGLQPTHSLISGPATISGSVVTITGAGTIVVRASQAGDANYLAAADVDQSITVNKASQTLTFDVISDKTYSGSSFTVSLSATASSGLTPVFTVVSGPATVTGSTLTVNGLGKVVVRASQPGDANYLAAADVDRSFTVTSTLFSGKIEAEHGELVSQTVVSASNASNAQAVNYSNNGTGSYLEWKVNNPALAARSCYFKVSYAGTSNATLKLYINGTYVKDLSFGSTGSTNTFQVVTTTETIPSGLSTIRLSGAGGTTTTPSVDKLDYEVLQSSSSLEAEATSVTKVNVSTISTTSTAVSNGEYVKFENNETVGSMEWSINKANPSEVSLVFRYLNNSSGSRSVTLTVNGVSETIKFPVTSTDTWADYTISKNFVAGSNTVKLSSTWQHYPYIDYLSFTSSPSISPTAVTPLNNNNIVVEQFDKSNTSSLQASCYPNPASSTVLLKVSNALPGSMDISVVSLDGKILKRLNHLSEGAVIELEMAVHNLISGMYLVKVLQGNQYTHTKLIIK